MPRSPLPGRSRFPPGSRAGAADAAARARRATAPLDSAGHARRAAPVHDRHRSCVPARCTDRAGARGDRPADARPQLRHGARNTAQGACPLSRDADAGPGRDGGRGRAPDDLSGAVSVHRRSRPWRSDRPADALRAVHLPRRGHTIVAPAARWVIRRVGYERLVLTACHPLYSAAQRIVVFARLVEPASS